MSSDASKLAYFDYDLPESSIAQVPREPRDAARMLTDLRVAGAKTPSDAMAGVNAPLSRTLANSDPVAQPAIDSTVSELANHLRPGDLVVVNNTRVLAARLLLHKKTGGKVEVFLLEPSGIPQQWRAMVRPGKRVPPGSELVFDGSPIVRVGEHLDDGLRLVTLLDDSAIDKAGNIPLPPYITTDLEDDSRYQTMFAERLGSVAAPTAGLHFTEAVCQSLKNREIGLETVELRVGLGTFRPISSEDITQHKMHAESYVIAPESWAAIQRCKAEGGRVVAVGTTVVRALESAAASGELQATTSLFIDRRFSWQIVDILLTNFHMPRSSLLVLLDSFEPGRWLELYGQAKELGYGFLSFGDCMLIEREGPPIGEQPIDGGPRRDESIDR